MDLRKRIEEYIPFNGQETKDKELILKLMDQYDNLLTRDNELAHFTSSGFTVNKERTKTLMIHHNIYNCWAWTGGHADGEEDTLAVALRENIEESGSKTVRPIIPDIYSIDVFAVPGHFKKGKYVSGHLHLSIGYLFEADENESLTIKEDENSGARWFSLDEAFTFNLHGETTYGKIIEKMRGDKL